MAFLEELKSRQKVRPYKAEAKNVEESTPIKSKNRRSLPLHAKSNPKPSKAHQTSLPDIPGSNDPISNIAIIQKAQKYQQQKNEDSSSSCIFADEEEKKETKYENKSDDTLSIYTSSTYASTTASNQSMNGRKKRRRKKKKKKTRIIQKGNHISVSQSHSPQHLSQHNLAQHNEMIVRKRNMNNGLTIINVIGDGIPTKQHKTDHYMIHNDDDDDGDDGDDDNKDDDNHNMTVLSPSAVIWSTNIFAFLCSVDLMINIPTLYKAFIDINEHLFIWILVIYVVFQIIAALVISMFMNHARIKWILVILSTFLFLGNILYTHSLSESNPSVFLLFIGRAMCGIAGSILINGYSINTLCSNILNREFLIVFFRFLTSMGMLIGPLIGLLLNINRWKDYINESNSGSFLVCIMAIMYLIIFIAYLVYSHLHHCYKIKHEYDANNDSVNDIANMHEKKQQNYAIKNIHRTRGESIKASREAIIQRHKSLDKYHDALLLSENRENHSLFCSKYVVLLLFLYISCLFTFWTLLSVIIPIGIYKSDDNNNQMIIYGVFAIVGFFYILSFVINRGLNYKIFQSISLDKRVIIAMQLQVIGYFLLTTFGIYDPLTLNSIPLLQLVFALWFIVVGFGIATLQIPAIFCLITGTKLKNIGIRMSWFFIISSIGRIIGPIFGYFIIKTQNGSIDLLAHLFAFYLIIICFIMLLAVMETKLSYFDKTMFDAQQKELETMPMIKLHSNRKELQRVESKSITKSLTPYSRAKFSSHFADDKSITNDREQSNSCNTYEINDNL